MPTVDNVGTDIHYEVTGAGPPLVLQHGRLGNGRFWFDSGYVDDLAQDHTLVVVDARGHGRSAKPADPDSYHPQSMASDIVAVLDDLNIEQADYLGYSMGGRIGFMTVAYFGDRIHSLIAGGAGPYGPATAAEAELGLAKTLTGGIEAYIAGLERMLDREIPDQDRKRLLANDAAALAALATATAEWPNVAGKVAFTRTPIQLFGGTADPIWKLIEQAHDELSSSQLHRFDGLGHGQDLRMPRLVLPVVRAFLEYRGLPGR